MGVTIHYRLAQRKEYVPEMLNRVEETARKIVTEQAAKVGVPFTISRKHPYRLHIDIGECETLSFGFGGMEHWKDENSREWSLEHAMLINVPEKLKEDDTLMWAAAFCKTQYAEKLLEHKWVADLIRLVASYCYYAEVYDEGKYYHTGRIEDAAEAIEANGRTIARLGEALKENFGADNVVAGGETKIHPVKTNNHTHLFKVAPDGIERCAVRGCEATKP